MTPFFEKRPHIWRSLDVNTCFGLNILIVTLVESMEGKYQENSAFLDLASKIS